MTGLADNGCTAFDVLAGKKLVGDHIAIIGGGEVGVETGSYISSLQNKVAIFEIPDITSNI